MTKRLTIALVALALFVLVAVMPVSALYYNVSPNINQGATVFIGEQGLNVSYALNKANFLVNQNTPGTLGYDDSTVPLNLTIGWWASAAAVTTTASSNQILIQGQNSYTISQTSFANYPGNYYLTNPNTGMGYVVSGSTSTPVLVFSVADPDLSVNVWDPAQGVSVNGKSVVQGTYLGIGVTSKMYQALDANYRFAIRPTKTTQAVYNFTGNRYSSSSPLTPLADTGDGWLDLKVKDENGAIFTGLYNVSGLSNSIIGLNMSVAEYKWGVTPGSTIRESSGTNVTNWSTGAINPVTNANAYPAGTYTVWAESMLNNMKANYQSGGADYTGKTISVAQTVQIVSDTVKITANKDTVVRSKGFSVTITGRPSQTYHVWVKGTSTLGGGYDAQAPMFNRPQAGVSFDPNSTGSTGFSSYAPGFAGNYSFQNGGGLTNNNIWSDVSHYGSTSANGTYLYANVSMSTSGTRTVDFVTTNWTKAQKYTIRVEQQFSGTANGLGDTNNAFLYGTGSYKSDEVDVKVEKGAVTIVAAGDQSYYLGEEIKFSGTNTETQTTYLFISGPNLQAVGSQIQNSDPRANAVVQGDASSFQTASVNGDNTWSWKWGTANVALDAGTYTIWAESGPASNTAANLAGVAYGTVSIVLKKPFISATASQSTLAQGDKIFISGTAEGSPSVGVQIWVLGKNYASVATQSVNADSTFSYEIKRTTTTNLAPGQYFIVGQHPMQNNVFDVYSASGLDGTASTASPSYVFNKQLGATTATPQGTKVFNLLGAGSLQGSDAAEALVQAINDPNVDDTYTKLQFLVENPVITIAPVGDRHVGDKFTIQATTNLAVDDEVLCQVYSSSFKPTQKTQSGEFSGTSATVKVTKGDTGLNKISFDVDASTFKPDEYIVQEDGVLVVVTGTALFNVLEGSAPTAVPTKVVTTVAPPVTTAAPTVPPTTVATPTKTPTQPGFGALVALIGLGAVAFLVVRRH